MGEENGNRKDITIGKRSREKSGIGAVNGDE